MQNIKSTWIYQNHHHISRLYFFLYVQMVVIILVDKDLWDSVQEWLGTWAAKNLQKRVAGNVSAFILDLLFFRFNIFIISWKM
jgi:hypothetical protein